MCVYVGGCLVFVGCLLVCVCIPCGCMCVYTMWVYTIYLPIYIELHILHGNAYIQCPHYFPPPSPLLSTTTLPPPPPPSPPLPTTTPLLPTPSPSHPLPHKIFQGSYIDQIGGNGPVLLDGSYGKASFNRPQGVAFDSNKRVLYVADTENHAVCVCCLMVCMFFVYSVCV